ncbi:MAG: DUF4340 domain-containing protein [Ignavibacteria bacterium]|nr:DUF4340 domain-containing protein [Ignavibacteria bacterium]
MKSNKTYLYFAILAALLVAAYYITSEKGDKTSSYELKEKKFFELDSAKVDKIEIKYTEGDLVLSKSSGEWKAVSPYDYRVVPSLVEKAISSLKNFNLESIVSTNPSKRETYGFNDSNMAEISVYEGGALKGKFIIGGSAAGTSSHVKKLILIISILPIILTELILLNLRLTNGEIKISSQYQKWPLILSNLFSRMKLTLQKKIPQEDSL